MNLASRAVVFSITDRPATQRCNRVNKHDINGSHSLCSPGYAAI